MDFKNWLSEQQFTGGRRNRVLQYPRRAERGAYSAVMANVRRDMGPEGKFLSRGRGSMYDPYSGQETNEVGPRMVGYASRVDPQGQTRDDRQVSYTARKELKERIDGDARLITLARAIRRKEVIMLYVKIDDDYGDAMTLDPNAQEHLDKEHAAVIFKFAQRGQR